MEPVVSIITPVYNEEEIIEASIRANLQIMTESGLPYEIIVVNDGSTDRSAEIIDRHFSQSPTIRIFHAERNQGFGGAVRRGIAMAKGTYLLCVPADSPLTQEIYHAFSSHFDKADVLVSHRIKRLGYSWWMLFNSTVYRWLLMLLFGMRLKDFNWMHMYHRKIFEEGGVTIEHEGIFMLAEVLIKAHRKGYTFAEFPVEQTQRITGEASVSKLSNILRTLKDVLTFYFKGK